jgi:multiple sugar transport system ATP-binding protein
MTMSDRIAVLDDGKLQQAGTPLECYHEPANEFVAGFIGDPSMNFFDVEVQGNQLRTGEFTYPVSEETMEDIGDRTTLRMGIRPEDVTLSTGDASAQHDFETVVDVVEPMGDENNVYLTFDTGGELQEDEEPFVVTVGGLQQIEAGQPVIAHIPEDAVHLFDASTGKSVKNRSLEQIESLEPTA